MSFQEFITFNGYGFMIALGFSIAALLVALFLDWIQK